MVALPAMFGRCMIYLRESPHWYGLQHGSLDPSQDRFYPRQNKAEETDLDTSLFNVQWVSFEAKRRFYVNLFNVPLLGTGNLLEWEGFGQPTLTLIEIMKALVGLILIVSWMVVIGVTETYFWVKRFMRTRYKHELHSVTWTLKLYQKAAHFAVLSISCSL